MCEAGGDLARIAAQTRAAYLERRVWDTTGDRGKSTEELGYDMYAWGRWYNEVRMPLRNERAVVESLSEEPGGSIPGRNGVVDCSRQLVRAMAR